MSLRDSRTSQHIARRIWMVSLWVAAFAVLALAPAAQAQVAASITGEVRDTSGAVIPGARVTVENVQTGLTRTLVTDTSGRYQALSIPVGSYAIQAERKGFKTIVRTGINLVVGQQAVVNLVLQVGAVTQSVTVRGGAPLVNRTTNSVSGLVNQQQVKELPLNGRSFDTLITLNPGTVNFTQVSHSSDDVTGFSFSVEGRRPGENVFLLNGIQYVGASHISDTPGGVSGQLLGIDAIREFNVQRDTYSAEYGKQPGAQIQITTTSGTNQLHGTVFEFLRNNKLDARNFFDRQRPPFQRNQFGAALGGPIRKNKTFIFGNYEAFRQRLGLSNVAFVPDDNARQGFLPDPKNPGQLINVGLAPGVAPQFALFPVANGPELGGGIAEAFSNPKQKIREDFGTVRGDQIFSDRDSLSSVLTIDDGTSDTPQENPLVSTTIVNRDTILSLEETHVFSPTLLNTFRAGFSRANLFFSQLATVPFPADLTFIQGRPQGIIKIGGGVAQTASSVTTAGGNKIGPAVRNLFTYEDNLQIVKGIHQITMGVWLQRVQSDDGLAAQQMGEASFGSLKGFLQGKVKTFTATPLPSELGWRSYEGAWFVQDAMKLRPNLTVNLGVRDEFTNGWNEAHGRGANFLQNPNGVLQSQTTISSSPLTSNEATKLFAPRVGVAWSPFGNSKTVIHAGAGIYYSLLDNLAFRLAADPPFNTKDELENVPLSSIRITPGTPVPAAQFAPEGIQGNLKTPTVEEWSFKIERELTPNMVVSVGYEGSHGYHETANQDLNTAFPTICSSALNNCPAGLPDGTKFFPKGVKRRNPNLANAFFWMSQSDSDYNALVVDLRRRFANGLFFRATYSYSKSLDDTSELADTGGTATPQMVLDPGDVPRDFGPSVFDVRHRFSFDAVYDLPFGNGRRFFNGVTGAADKLIRGWQANTIVSLQSGFPFTPILGFNNSRDGNKRNPDRPSINPNFSGPVIVGSPNEYFNPAAFIIPPAGTYGNLSRDSLTGPNLKDVDFSVYKTTAITERLKLQFRFEAFNIFNRANFSAPSNVVFTSKGAVAPTAGVISSTATTARELQFALKLIF